jgi:hypothetical protein
MSGNPMSAFDPKRTWWNYLKAVARQCVTGKAPIGDTHHIPNLGDRIKSKIKRVTTASRTKGEFRCARLAFLLSPLR